MEGHGAITTRDYTRYSGNVRTAFYSFDGKKIVTASSERTVKIWDADTLELAGSFDMYGGEKYRYGQSVSFAVFNPDGTKILASANDGTAIIIDTKTFEKIYELVGHNSIINSAFFSSDGGPIFTASADGTIKIWDSSTYECLNTIKNEPGLNLVDVDFRHLNPQSIFTDEEKEILKTYGAVVN